MDEEKIRAFCEAFALVDAGLELQGSEIARIRRNLSEHVAQVTAAESNDQWRELSMSRAFFQAIGAMEGLVESMRKAQEGIERILNEWKAKK